MYLCIYVGNSLFQMLPSSPSPSRAYDTHLCSVNYYLSPIIYCYFLSETHLMLPLFIKNE